MSLTAEKIIQEFKLIQDEICRDLESLDGQGKFIEDLWDRSEGGGGRTRILEGHIIEKGGVNFSHVYGNVSDEMAAAMNMVGERWLASGVSIVLHPSSPRVPIIHMNIRYFELDGGREWWFGGGIDLTPHYVDPGLAKDFHIKLKEVCDNFSSTAYAEYKKWADDYFYLPHRKESRGVGGIFFDRLNGDSGHSKEEIFDFVTAVGRIFAQLYQYQVDQTKELAFGDGEKEWQMIRRGRYVEFNLVWDRGTKFGLISDGRTESILMSLPKNASWQYQYQPGPKETESQKWLQKGIEWI
ncbi:oxygen-dependent coproporphyrinogen oxidase [Membranihabitans marinus]|uniref:oxygen-dependent coproporphyrinogen oxidase n=1 Tax=Membranihabitans marinus TaxID=1227546 RepID=UPI001EFF8EC7|nr:oxygen-dependent coproporphyrinogen oxidase [Membranihabitans marinus]